jgi:hypothetical protein
MDVKAISVGRLLYPKTGQVGVASPFAKVQYIGFAHAPTYNVQAHSYNSFAPLPH